MRVNKLDLNQLACLDALLSERSVSRAAERVYLSQPAVSATLARLRAFFGDQLLVLVGRQLILTPFAESLIEPVRDLLLQAQALTRRRPEADPKLIEREVTIVGSDYVASVVLAPMIKLAETEAPGLCFDVRSINGFLAEELEQGDVDLVVSLASGASPLHPSELLFRDTFSCIACESNGEIGKTLSAKRYLEFGHVVTILGRGRVPTVDQIAMDTQNLKRRIEVKVPSFTMAPTYIVGTKRIATVQTQLARALAKQWPLKVMPCPIAIPEVVMSVQWHRYQTHDPTIQWVLGALREATRAAKLTPP